jgi:hypothetical protein
MPKPPPQPPAPALPCSPCFRVTCSRVMYSRVVFSRVMCSRIHSFRDIFKKRYYFSLRNCSSFVPRNKSHSLFTVHCSPLSSLYSFLLRYAERISHPQAVSADQNRADTQVRPYHLPSSLRGLVSWSIAICTPCRFTKLCQSNRTEAVFTRYWGIASAKCASQ